jgi:hypothetical protein
MVCFGSRSGRSAASTFEQHRSRDRRQASMAFIDDRQKRKERRFITHHRNEPVHRIGSGPAPPMRRITSLDPREKALGLTSPHPYRRHAPSDADGQPHVSSRCRRPMPALSSPGDLLAARRPPNASAIQSSVALPCQPGRRSHIPPLSPPPSGLNGGKLHAKVNKTGVRLWTDCRFSPDRRIARLELSPHQFSNFIARSVPKHVQWQRQQSGIGPASRATRSDGDGSLGLTDRVRGCEA